MGGKRGRVFGNSYKGHMEKNRGRVGSRVGSGGGWCGEEWWGKNGDNCT